MSLGAYTEFIKYNYDNVSQGLGSEATPQDIVEYLFKSWKLLTAEEQDQYENYRKQRLTAEYMSEGGNDQEEYETGSGGGSDDEEDEDKEKPKKESSRRPLPKRKPVRKAETKKTEVPKRKPARKSGTKKAEVPKREPAKKAETKQAEIPTTEAVEGSLRQGRTKNPPSPYGMFIRENFDAWAQKNLERTPNRKGELRYPADAVTKFADANKEEWRRIKENPRLYKKYVDLAAEQLKKDTAIRRRLIPTYHTLMALLEREWAPAWYATQNPQGSTLVPYNRARFEQYARQRWTTLSDSEKNHYNDLAVELRNREISGEEE